MSAVRSGIISFLSIALAVVPAVGATAQDAAPDLLPGVDLVTDEVEPGVYRVLSDGHRDPSIPVGGDRMWIGPSSRIVVAPDESVWVFGPKEFYRLGDARSHGGKRWSMVDVDADGTVWALLAPGPETDDDGYGDHRHRDLSTFDGEQWHKKAGKVVDFRLHPDGSTWIALDTNDGRVPGLQPAVGPVHDGRWHDVGVVEPWEWGGVPAGSGGGYGGFAVSPLARPGDPYPSYSGWLVDGRGVLQDADWHSSGQGGGWTCCSVAGDVVGLGYGSDGSSWVNLRFDVPHLRDGELTSDPEYFLARFAPYLSEQRLQRVYESEATSLAATGPHHPEGFAEHLDVAPDGSVWLPTDDGLARFDGESWRWFLRGDAIEDVDIASDGQVWVQANDALLHGDAPPLSEQEATTETYVITPEAVATTE